MTSTADAKHEEIAMKYGTVQTTARISETKHSVTELEVAATGHAATAGRVT